MVKTRAAEGGKQEKLRWTRGSGRHRGVQVKEEELGGRIDTYPALLLSSCQPRDWSGLGWALLSRWGRATQNHTPKDEKKGSKRKVWRGKGDGEVKEEETGK